VCVRASGTGREARITRRTSVILSDVPRASRPTTVTRMQQTTARRTTRSLAVAALAASALALAGCAGDGGHTVGEAVTTKLNGSPFSGRLDMKATKVERVTDAAMDQFGLSPKGDDAYFAHFTVRVEEGTFPVDATKDLGNSAFGLQADGKLQAGPTLASDDRNETLQEACPDRPAKVASALRAGDTADVCAVLLAPAGSTVDAVSYLRAAPVDEGLEGDATITWRSDDA
jgi:hypothetical protein